MRIFVSCMLMWHFLHQQVAKLHAVAARPHGAVLLLLALPLPPGQAGPRQPAQQRREVAPSVVTTICSGDFFSYDNSVNWYYSSYNQDTSSSQRRDPGPGPRRQRTSAAASLGSVWSSVVTPALLLILLSYRQWYAACYFCFLHLVKFSHFMHNVINH